MEFEEFNEEEDELPDYFSCKLAEAIGPSIKILMLGFWFEI